MKARLYCLFVLVLTFFTAHADTFIVTSNADSGPGTLRAAIALAAANGILVNDYINFNLPGNTETERTILLLSELPLVSGHVILDATTQPGPNLSNSPAKIMIKANRSVYISTASELGCFNIISVTDVQIYGFAFDQFKSLRLNPNSSATSIYSNAIYIKSSSGITIGAPGKGNAFMQNEFGIYASTNDSYQITNGKIKIQSNWFGLNFDGSESRIDRTELIHVLANDSEIGGPDQTYGNFFSGNAVWGMLVSGNNTNIRFNRFGFLGNGTLGEGIIPLSLNITQGEFTDNQATRFVIKCQGKNVKILRNKEFTIPIVTKDERIEIYYTENIQIGSDNIADANEFQQSSLGPIFNYGSKNVEVRKNIIHCTQYAYSIRDGVVAVAIEVLVNNDTEYSGTATPNSEVYIYNDYSDCISCSPLQFYTKIIADATGKWRITGNFSSYKFVANATLINTSSEFTQPFFFTESNYWCWKFEPSCGLSNGIFEVAKPAHILKVEWYKVNGEKVGEGFRITGLPPGDYYAKGYNGKCYTTSPIISLYNVEPKIITNNLTFNHPGCGEKNGFIKGLYYSLNNGTATYKWINENGEVMPSVGTDLNNLGPGSYTFVVTTATNCEKSYGPIVLENTDGPNINRVKAVVTNANCDLSDGSIIGATAAGTGNIQFTWKDENNTPIRQIADLKNVKAGKYTLEVKDESTCGVISTSFEIFAENTIGIDEQPVQKTKSTCGKANGTITGIKIIGTASVKWFSENNEPVSESINLIGMPAGKYKLVISNAYCSKTSSVFTIEEANNNLNYTSVKQVKNATCNQDNGRIDLSFNQAMPRSFKWLDDNDNPVTGTTSISSLAAGFYKLYIRDENDCESLYDTYEIKTISPPILDEALVEVEDDKCGLKTGTIKKINVSGGTTPYHYEWRNQAHELIGTNPDLNNAPAGIYTVQVFDSNDCTILSSPFNILIKTSSIPAPNILPVQICAAGKAIIAPDQIKEGSFLLYKSLTAIEPMAVTKDVFNVQVNKTETYFVSHSNGICESERVPVLIEVTENSLHIASSFSPNSDGFNDTWRINNLENYPEFSLKIYNRYGQNVFSTRDPHFLFEGTSNGVALPVGVYYYVLNLRKGCATISGSLMLIK